MLNYHKYNTFYNYLVSDWTKKFEPYEEVKLFLTNTDDPTEFVPDNLYYISYSANSAKFINAEGNISGIHNTEDTRCDSVLLNQQLYSDDDQTGDGAVLGTYEQMMDIPASANAYKCPFLYSYKGRARNEALMNGEERLSDEEATRRCFAWKDRFDEDEYDKFSIPMTELNQPTVCLNADKVVVSAKEKFEAKGALLAVKIEDNLFPIDFMYWSKSDFYNQYVFDWSPNGIIKVK